MAPWGLPVRWNNDDWRDDLAELPRYAALAAEMGANRVSTWCPPSSSERAFDKNFAWHLGRFGAIAEVLSEHGITLRHRVYWTAELAPGG